MLMFWVVAMGVGVVGFAWFKIRRRRKVANAASVADVPNVTKAA